ncbi:MAG: bifunctional adenosylcobinamide kinase/adenosylcobinamide-phosphate guanylyltransferase, partial [Alphaproteobacteria bacterium]
MSDSLPKITLVLGGARSGKSHFAENLARESGLPKVYLATAEAYDAEMETRIQRHQQDRGPDWTTVEEPIDLATMLQKHSLENNIILVDCLTLWLGNLMGRGSDIMAEFDRLLAILDELKGPVIFVSNEVGQGIVPDNALAREFRDCAGRLHQRLAAKAERVYFITAGIP